MIVRVMQCLGLSMLFTAIILGNFSPSSWTPDQKMFAIIMGLAYPIFEAVYGRLERMRDR